MKRIKLYDWQSKFDFGQCEEKTVKEIFENSPSYISWCFQKVDWFCITDEIFNKLPIVITLKTDSEKVAWLEMLTEKHSNKKEKLQEEIQRNKTENEFTISDEEPYFSGDPRHDRDENPWIDILGDEDEAETAYWNTE